MKRDYREKDVDGIIFDGLYIKPSRITVRMTSDKYGQSLSLTAWNVQFQIPLDAVSDIIKVVEKG